MIIARKVFKRHQREALAYALTRDAIGLFLDMRLGKTPVCIRWARKRRFKRVLLIAPLDVLPGMQWEAELRQEGVWPVCIWPNEKRDLWLEAAATSSMGWYGINYEAVRNNPDILDWHWDLIVLDESTRIRNPKAQITKIILASTDHIRHRAILSGLPNPESSLDLFCQMKFLHGEFLGYDNYWHFRQAKFNNVFYDWVPRKGVREQIKQSVHSTCFIRSRKQTGLGNKRVFERRYVVMNAVQKTMQTSLNRDFMAGTKETKWAPVQQTWMARLAGGFDPDLTLVADGKYSLLSRIVTEERPREQIVVWFRFTKEIQEAARRLRKKNVKIAVITGATKKRIRPQIQRDFHAGKFRVLLMQVKIGQYGLNLSCANTAIYFSNVWDAEVRLQSMERIEHMAKHMPLLFIDLITRSSVDEAVLDALQEKKQDSRSILRQVMSRLVADLRRTA